MQKKRQIASFAESIALPETVIQMTTSHQFPP